MTSKIVEMSLTIPGILLALTVHEYAHAWVADKLGDPTARLLGRLTLNPLAHLEPIGTLGLIFFHFGWAKPVPVDWRHLRNPRRDMMWIAAAGPAVNLALATFFAQVLRLVGSLTVSPANQWLLVPVAGMVFWSVYINVVLAIFNLIPIPPLDGGRVVAGLLPPYQAAAFSRLEPYGVVILVLLIFSGAVRVISPTISVVTHFLLGA